MGISNTERRLIENEMIFRRNNEKVANQLDALDAMHAEDGHFDLKRDEDLELQFKCECSDENCTSRILMSITTYQEIHKDRNVFIVLPNHQTATIEAVLKKTKTYYVVKKNKIVSEPAKSTLNVTAVDNL